MNTAPELQVDTWLTPHGHGISMVTRPDTSDWNTVSACNGSNDEYHLPEGLQGWALDVGAHIGALTVPLLVDNSGLRAVAIEALPENVELLRMNLERNGVSDRCTVIEGAASRSAEPVRIGYGEVTDPSRVHEFIGNAQAPEGSREISAEGITLTRVMLRVLPDYVPITWMKIDCEGCEYSFLDNPYVDQIAYIEGEVHFGAQRLRDLLDATHVVTADKDFGPFTAVRR